MISILIETLEELGYALQAADLTRAETCRTFALRILGAKLQPNLEQIDTILDRAAALAATHYHIAVAELYGLDRAYRVSHPRQLAMYLARARGITLGAIGRHFHRDHGSALFACRAVQDRIDTDPALALAVQQMLAQLNPVAAEGARLTSKAA